MKKILVSAFEPFGGMDKNSSYEVLQQLEKRTDIDRIVLPVVYQKAATLLIEQIKKYPYEAVLALGQASGRRQVSLEAIGINLRHSQREDNAHTMYWFKKIDETGPDGLFSTLPLEAIMKRWEKEHLGILSYSAGSYVCNDVLYSLLNEAKKEKCTIRIGFIHLPLLKEQDQDNGLNIEEMLKAVDVCLDEIQKSCRE